MSFKKQAFSTLLVVIIAQHAFTQESSIDPFEQMDQLLDQKFSDFDDTIDAQYDKVNTAIANAYAGLTKKIEFQWGEDVKLPTAKSWTTYSNDMRSRVELNFEAGEYIAEVLVKDNDVEQATTKLNTLMDELQNANTRELNRKDAFLNELDDALKAEQILDTQAYSSTESSASPLVSQIVDIPENSVITAAVLKEVFESRHLTKNVNDLKSDVLPPTEDSISENIQPPKDFKKTTAEANKVSSNNAAAIEKPEKIDLIAKNQPKVEIDRDDSGNPEKIRIKIKFINGYQKQILNRHFEDIQRIANDFEIPVSTVLAIMETESSFNPRATSPIPAFGLMQVVPKTAGIDAYRHVYGEKKVVSAEFLYDELNNIMMGTAYFNLLDNRYLRDISNGESRFYCAVASYNTGVGNLAKTFTGEKNIRAAANVINAMEPNEVYEFLIENLPALETQNYLRKIVKRAEKYKIFNEGTI